jgi:homoserine kinase type II
MTRWLRGSADFHERPTIERLTAAMTALARIHIAAGYSRGDCSNGPSLGLTQRDDRIHRLFESCIANLSLSIDDRCGSELRDLTRRTLELIPSQLPTCRQLLASLRGTTTSLMPCLRDIWHDHVLFEENGVTGIIDFGAMRIDTPAGDISRLIGSLVGNDSRLRWAALDAYSMIRPISSAERLMIPAFDLASLILSGVNWVQWLYVEGRTFPDLRRVVTRIMEINERLATWLPPPRSVIAPPTTISGQ